MNRDKMHLVNKLFNNETIRTIWDDGKYRMTDVVDIEGMLRIIESIPSKNAENLLLNYMIINITF